jgi:hypothetical protein
MSRARRSRRDRLWVARDRSCHGVAASGFGNGREAPGGHGLRGFRLGGSSFLVVDLRLQRGLESMWRVALAALILIACGGRAEEPSSEGSGTSSGGPEGGSGSSSSGSGPSSGGSGSSSGTAGSGSGTGGSGSGGWTILCNPSCGATTVAHGADMCTGHQICGSTNGALTGPFACCTPGQECVRIFGSLCDGG